MTAVSSLETFAIVLRRQPRRLIRLLICQIFVLNLLTAAIVDAHAAGGSQFESMLLNARCGDSVALANADRKVDAKPARVPVDQGPAGQSPGKSHSCPLCATACPLGGCAPVDAGALSTPTAARMPRDFPGIGRFLHLVSVKPARLLSDAAAQAPPTPAGSRVHMVSELS